MIYLKQIIRSLVVPILFSGCATLQQNQIQVAVHSQPSGALIYENGNAIGTTPLQRVLRLSPQGMAQGYAIWDVYVVWPSGATSTKGAKLQTSKGQNQTLTFSRPSNAPGLDIDLNHEARLRATAASEAQAEAMENAASEARAAREAAEDAARQSKKTNNRIDNCLLLDICL